MSQPQTLFDKTYESLKRPLLKDVCDQLRDIFNPEELAVLRIDRINPGILSHRSGRGFVNRDILETVLGNLLEFAAPGSHNATETTTALDFDHGVKKCVISFTR